MHFTIVSRSHNCCRRHSGPHRPWSAGSCTSGTLATGDAVILACRSQRTFIMGSLYIIMPRAGQRTDTCGDLVIFWRDVLRRHFMSWSVRDATLEDALEDGMKPGGWRNNCHRHLALAPPLNLAPPETAPLLVVPLPVAPLPVAPLLPAEFALAGSAAGRLFGTAVWQSSARQPATSCWK